MSNTTNIEHIAYLNGIAFPHNPNSIDWSYTLNKTSYNTVGGRVTQVLSTKIDTMMWQGDAGNRENLLNLFHNFKQIQNQQVEHETSVELSVPSRNWNIKVWARSMDVGWDYQSVTYPYRIQFEVEEDYGQITNGIITQELERLASGIGFNKYYSGMKKNPGSVNTSAEYVYQTYYGGSGA